MQAQTPPGRIPDQFANVYRLGNLQSIYPVGASSRWVSAVVGIVLILGGGLAAAYGVIDTYLQVSKYGPVMFAKSIVAPAIIAGFMLLFGILAAVNAFLNWNKSVALYEHGLAYSDNKGVQSWTWFDVYLLFTSITRHYHNGIYTGTTYVYTLQKADGAKISLDNKFKQIELLGKSINQRVAPLQYERLVQHIQSGQTATLGPVSISTDGLTINKKSYAWSEIESVGIKNGSITVKKQDGGLFSGAAVMVSSVPNLDALLAVIERYCKVTSG